MRNLSEQEFRGFLKRFKQGYLTLDFSTRNNTSDSFFRKNIENLKVYMKDVKSILTENQEDFYLEQFDFWLENKPLTKNQMSIIAEFIANNFFITLLEKRGWTPEKMEKEGWRENDVTIILNLPSDLKVK